MAERERWGSKAGFVMAAVGSAVGLGNIWRFPYLAYENGGGAFWCPMCSPCSPRACRLWSWSSAWASAPGFLLRAALARLGRGGRMLGWWQVALGFFILAYYCAILAWVLCYIFFAMDLTWGSDPQAFFFERFLEATSGPLNHGQIRWTILAGLAGVWAMVWLVLWRGVKRGIELACKVLIPILAALLIVMLVMSLRLPGAWQGVKWLFEPDFSRLTDFRVWADAYSQVFYSVGVFFAIMIAYGSYLPEDADITGSATITVFVNSGFSLLAGAMIFAILGSFAHGRGVPKDQVAASGISLAFISVPSAIELMPLPRLAGVFFFSALLLAGISSAISITEAVAAPLIRASDKSRHAVVSLVCLAGFGASLVYVWGSALHLIDLADHFLSNYGLLCLGLAELWLVAWYSGRLADMRRFANATSDIKIGLPWEIVLRWINPPILATTVVLLLWDDLKISDSGGLQAHGLVLGAVLILVTLAAAFLANRLDPQRA
jgi:NSS family neurotransmitter:Na+ symporter